MSEKKNVLVTSLYGKQRTPTLLKVGQGIVGLHVGLGLVGCDTNGNEILEGSLELVVKLDSLGHGKVVQLVGEHDGTNLATGQQGGAMKNKIRLRTVLKAPLPASAIRFS